MFQRFSWFLKKYYKRYFLGIFFLILSNIFGLIPPYIVGILTDKIVADGLVLDEFLKLLGIFLGVILLKYIVAFFWVYFIMSGSVQIEYLTRNRLLRKFLRQSQVFFEKNSTGSLMGKSTNDVDTIADYAGFGTLAMIDATVLPMAIIIVMAIAVDWRLTLFSILPLPLLAIMVLKIGDIIYERFAKVQVSFDRVNDTVLEDVSGIRLIRTFNLQKYREELFKEKAEKLKDESKKLVRYRAMIRSIQNIIPALTFIIAISYGSFLISRGEITIGNLVSFTYYLNILIWPMYALGEYINLRQRAFASMDRIQELWDYEEDMKEGTLELEKSQTPDILFEDFSFSYPESDLVLKDICVHLPKGKSLGVLGPTGSGKTTFLKQILAQYPADYNHLLIDGKPLDDYTFSSIRDHTAYIPQKNRIFSKTIGENIAFSKPEATEEEILEAVRLADFEKDLEEFPEKLDTLAGERGVSLSGGQQQRIGLARAFLKDAEILLLDDALSAVDGTTEQNILRNMKSLQKEQTTIIACHRISQVMDCDEIIVLNHGHIVERGTHEELLENKQWYYRQFIRQTGEGGGVVEN